MADYIDREELLKALKKEFRQNDYIKHDSYFELKNIVETMPTVEQKHGHWIKCMRLGDIKADFDTFRCSCCDQLVVALTVKHNKYCMNCGAKMDEVTE